MNESSNHRNDGRHRARGGEGAKKTIEILPSPELLERYDDLVEGSAEMILSMFEREQKHRHHWESRALKVHSTSTILGQVLGFFIAVAVFVSASVIGVYGDKMLGATIWVFGICIIVMAALVWSYAKTLGQRPLFGRPTMRTHFRPHKDKTEEATEN